MTRVFISRFKFSILLIFISSSIVFGQGNIMSVHKKNGEVHSYLCNDIDSVSFVEIKEVLKPIKANTEMMLPEMLSVENVHDYFSLTDHYLKTGYKDLRENIFGSSVAGQYALMPLDKNKMVKLYGGGKYLVSKYGTNHAEALYDANLNPVCAFSPDRGNATYVNNNMSYTIDLTDKEGIYYLRRFIRFAYADKMSVKVINEFQPIGLTSYSNLKSLSLSDLQKDDKHYLVPFTKSQGRIAFDFTINTDCNIDATDINLIQLEMIDGIRNISILRREPEQLSIRYYGDNESIEKADAQELLFRSGFIFGTDTIIRSADFYKPLAGKPCMYIWLKGQEFTEEPTEAQLLDRSESLATYNDYYISIQNGQLCLFDGENIVTSIILSDKTLLDLKRELESNNAFQDFTIYIFEGSEQLSAAELMAFNRIKLVSNYYQSFDLCNYNHVSDFDYHLDSYPIPLRQKKDTTVHTFEGIFSKDGVYVGIDGHFALLDYDLIKNVLIDDENISISNINIEDGDTENFYHKFAGSTRLSQPYVLTDRSPFLLGLMGHLVKSNSTEGNVNYPASDVSSARLNRMCNLMSDENYVTLSMDQLVDYMDAGMSFGKYAFFMFDDFRFDCIWEEKSTRDIFLDNSFKANLAIIHQYLWNNEKCRQYIEPMKEIAWNCVSHSLRHNMPTGKKCSVALDYELRQIKKEAKDFGFNHEVFVYNWDGTWEPADILLQKNGFKYAINSRGTYTVKGTNPYRMGRTSFQEELPFSTIEKSIKW